MVQYLFTPELAERVITTPVRTALRELVAETDWSGEEADKYIQSSMQRVLTFSFGRFLLKSAETFASPVEAHTSQTGEAGRAIAFMYGGIFARQAIDEGDQTLLASLDDYIETTFGKNSANGLSCEDIICQSWQVLDVLDMNEAFAEAEEDLFENIDLDPYFRVGVGWVIYHAVMGAANERA